MDVEATLVSKVVGTAGIETTIARGIQPEHFNDPDCRGVYETCVQHVRQYKTPPSRDAVRDAHPDFAFDITSDSLEYLIDRFIGLVKYRETTKAVRELAKRTEQPDNWDTLDLDVLEVARDLATLVPSSKISRLSDAHKRIDEYKRRKELGQLHGIKTGIPKIDELTFGFQPHEYISIVGWQGVGKSTLMQIMLFNAYLQGHTPMLISLEMEAEALFRKWDTMATNLSYRAMKAMELGEGDMKKWYEWAEKAENACADRDIIVIDDIGKCTVDKVFAETVRYSPDIVAIDYVSLMDAPQGIGALWEKVTYCTKGLKQNARTLKTPMIGLAQTNADDGGDGAELRNIAYSRSIGQDSDLVFGLYQKEEWKEREKMEVRLLKNRDGKQGRTQMHWNPERMEFRELNEADFFKPREAAAA